MKVRDIIAALEELAPLSVQEKWDNSGLSVGSPEAEVRGVLIGFDCTAELIDEAVEKDCNLVITHHPLIFGGISRISPEDPVGEAVIRAIRSGVAVYSAHTSADKVRGGVSWSWGERLGLRNMEILEPDGDASVGLGVIGDLSPALPVKEVLSLLRRRFQLPLIRTSRPLEIPISRLAFCGGSGSSLIDCARRSGAQLYVSADISYHHFFTPEGFMIADIGHFESEVHIAEIFIKELTKKFPTFAVRLSERLRQNNPIYYYM